ncbi:MAG: aldo/keto reductase [Coriobacteriales bacterium]|jgi:predicted aldo/keto reductase-like oxidoreductase
MLYNDFQGKQISRYGFGAMRLPTIGGDDSKIDIPQTKQMVADAMAAGVNYYDTGYDYHGGNSESVLGAALADYPRESFYFADKWPGYNRANFGRAAEIFEQQLARSGMGYFDFYMLHNVCELNIDLYLAEEKYGTVAYLLEQKAAGRIKHFGFSAHGNIDTIRRILDRFGEHFEFCQLQVNWLDWDFQQAREKVELYREHGLPVIVMEPLRGGKLARLSDSEMARLEELRPGVSGVEWSFDFLKGIDGIATVLSGASSIEQAHDNIRIFSEDTKLTDEQLAALAELATEMTSVDSVPCTACKYCINHCPMELDIPWLIELWNEHRFTGSHGFITPMALGGLPEDKRPAACIGCKTCEEFCPQQIAIADVLAEFAENVSAW